MKRVILLLTFLFTSLIFSQSKYYTFSELNGMEDQSGHTHLFYRLYYDKEIPNYTDMSNNIYHLDIFNKVDTLFLADGYYSNPAWQSGGGASNLEFWNNDPTKYIYIETYCGIDCDGGLVRYDSLGFNLGIDLPTTFGLSKQNDSLIYIGTMSGESFKSVDGGKSAVILNDSVSFYSLFPFNDKIVFGDYEGNLAKSKDSGVTFIPTNLSINTQLNNAIQYDKDKLHIYLLNYKGLIISSDTGNTWEIKHSMPQLPYNFHPYISVDKSISGSIYLADGKNILHSTNYGDSFKVFKKLDHDIVGIYKKPNSDKLYAATKYNLVEITGDSIKTIKSLPIDPKIFSYYPLAVGDKWIYNYHNVDEGGYIPIYTNGITTREVIGDSLMDNGEKYFIVKDFHDKINYERIDSSSGKILRYTADSSVSNNEFIIDDLLAEVGDTIYSNYYTRYMGNFAIFLSEKNVNIFNKTVSNRIYMSENVLEYPAYILTQGFGLTSYSFEYDFGYTTDTLKGAIINGVVYGDTTITGIKEQKKIPQQFKLFQNYPNPFNPTTAISYRLSAYSHVSLKIYDVLGREVKTLVNENQAAGEHKTEWNAENVACGVYFYRIRAGEFVSTKKMLLIK